MPYQLTIAEQPSYLHATASGTRTAESAVRFLEEAYKACVERGYSDVLLEMNLSGPSLDLGSIFGVIMQRVSDARKLRRIAYVDTMAMDPGRARFAETVAINRGVGVRLFGNLDDARQWLSGAGAEAVREGPTMACSVAIEAIDQEEALALVRELDAHLEPLYPPESRHGLDIEALRATNVRFVLARDDQGVAHGCGAVVFLPDYAELKRMFVRPQSRGRGIADAIVRFLEGQAAERGYATVRLETGIRQAEALSFYRRLGYARRGPFGSYRPDPLSVCMEKHIDG
jgi:putative acetyltransferase